MSPDPLETFDPDAPVPYRPIWLVWRDHTQDDGLTFRPSHPTPILLRGVTNLLAETEDSYIVAGFVGQEEFCVFNRTAICKSDVLEIREVSLD